MLSEPKSKQKNKKQVHQFVVLNHIFFFNAASLAALVVGKEPKKFPAEIIHTAKKSMSVLAESLKEFNEEVKLPSHIFSKEEGEEKELSADQVLLKEQLDFIYRLTKDIDKTTKHIIAA